MRAQPQFTKSNPRSYEQIGQRVQRIIADPNIQKIQVAVVSRQEGESLPDWRRLIKDLAATDGIHVEELEGDAVKIGWREYLDV